MNGDTGSARPTLSLVTVTFEAEYDLLRLQYSSLGIHAAAGLFDEIVLIDNGRRPLPERVVKTLRSDLGPLGTRLRVVPADSLAARDASSGWLHQQVLKLAVARHIDTSHYLLLDAKNHVLRPISVDDLFADDGLPRAGRHSYEGHTLRGAVEHSLAYFGLPLRLAESFTPTHTPYLVTTHQARHLMDAVEAREGTTLDDFFRRAGVTEFGLYGAFLAAQDGSLDAAMSRTPLSAGFVWPGRRSRSDAQRLIGEARSKGTAFFSVHRAALARLSPAARRDLHNLWIERGLLTSRRAAWWFEGRFLARFGAFALSRRARRTWRRARSVVDVRHG